ncbi:laminin subunit alpha-3-like [Clupea harengus]|uniref:Laminin subunit alpha-3-like n=1 Tax=Clupea harengus TaxID=7950 RepID=A0A6P8ESS0_CLUHA|nr:laminin subunit alpha-3-like [Clupea harengus]
MKDLEGMDDELSRLKSKLGKLTGSSIPLAQLKKLEEAITVTRELLSRLKASAVSLEPKVKQLEMDMGTIDEDLVTLDNKARKLFPQSEEVLKTVNHTKHRSQELLNSVGDLLDDIQDLLDQIARGNHTSGPVSDKDAVRMLGEAKHLVQEMRRQNCSGQRTVAHTELRQAQNLLDYITRNLTDPSSTNQALADRIGGSLMRDLARLRDLQKALEHAEGALKSTHKLNHQSQATLRRLQSRAMELRESKDSVTSGLQMTRQLLGNVSDQLSMMQDIKTEYEHLAAQLDGAESDLVKKLGSLSSLASVAGLVQQAEIHARNLSDLAMALSMKLQSVVKGSNVHHFFEVIRAYTDIIEAVEKAETAAREAKEAADSALEDVTRQNLISRASSLIVDAKKPAVQSQGAEKNLNDTAEELGSQQERVGRVKDKMAALWRDLQASQQNLSMINRGDTDALLNSTKAAVSSAEARVKAMTTRLQEISAGLKNISVPSAGAGSGGSDLDGVLNQANNACESHTGPWVLAPSGLGGHSSLPFYLYHPTATA